MYEKIIIDYSSKSSLHLFKLSTVQAHTEGRQVPKLDLQDAERNERLSSSMSPSCEHDGSIICSHCHCLTSMTVESFSGIRRHCKKNFAGEKQQTDVVLRKKKTLPASSEQQGPTIIKLMLLWLCDAVTVIASGHPRCIIK